ncbi:MAG TPA: zinc ribbon domain-containing protein [Pirellulales bacterium]|nr:zinc ribbon domain-containing protein [Pirellulales bacterium]
MVPCKACSQPISAQAKICPNCGHPQPKDNVFAWFVTLLVVSPFVLSWLAGTKQEYKFEPVATPQLDRERQRTALALLETYERQLKSSRTEMAQFGGLGHPAVAEGLRLTDSMLGEIAVVEQRIRAKVASEDEIARIGERIGKFSEALKKLAASL